MLQPSELLFGTPDTHVFESLRRTYIWFSDRPQVSFQIIDWKDHQESKNPKWCLFIKVSSFPEFSKTFKHRETWEDKLLKFLCLSFLA